MKQTISLAIAMMVAISGVFAKDNTNASKRTTVKGDNVSVTYGPAAKNGRTIFGMPTDNPVIPYGTMWGTGDGQAAQITFTKTCLIGGNKKEVKAGTYTLLTRPAQGEWVFQFSTQLNQNGSADYEKYKKTVFLSTWGLTKHLEKPVENLTITAQKDGLLLEWDQTSVLLPVTAAN